MHEDDNIFGAAAPTTAAVTLEPKQRHSRAASRFTLEPIDAPAPSASPASFAARRKRQSLFDEEETEELLAAAGKKATPTPVTAAAAAAAGDDAATAASTAAHTSAAAPSIALAAFSEALPVDEDLAQMLASFSPSLQLELAGSSGASPSLSLSTQAADSSKPFFASASSSRRVDELEFDRWGSASAKSPGGTGAALFGDLFGERGATPSASPSNNDSKAAHRKLTDSLYQVWPKDETGADSGRSRARTLKLTESELQALNLDGSVSKSFPYSDIFCVTCQETTRLLGPPLSADDPSIAADGVVRSVSISFISDADLSYISPQAVQLSADLNERLSMRTSAEEPVAAANGTAGHVDRLFDGQAYHEKLLAQQLQEPAATTVVDPTAVFFTPAIASSSSAAPSSASGAGRGSVSAATPPAAAATSSKADAPKGSFAERAQKNGARSAAAPHDAASASSSSSAASADPAFLAWQARYALDQKLQSMIDRIWLDSTSEEGKARSKFLKTSFPALESKPSTLMASTRKFLDSFRTYMEKKRVGQLREAIVGSKDGEGLLSAKEFEATFHARVERSAEVAVLMPILPRLNAAVAPLTREADQQILAQMTLLRGKSQSHMGIPPQHHSPSGWSAAIRELLQVDRFHLPADKLEVILGMVKCVYSTYKMEREMSMRQREGDNGAAKETTAVEATAMAASTAVSAAPVAAVSGDSATAAAAATPATTSAAGAATASPAVAVVSKPAAKSNSSMFLPADDLFPILIYIVSESGLKNAATLKASLWALCDPQQLQAEGQRRGGDKHTLKGARHCAHTRFSEHQQSDFSLRCFLSAVLLLRSLSSLFSGGYYLTAFDAAIEYIRTVDASKPMDNSAPAKKRR